MLNWLKTLFLSQPKQEFESAQESKPELDPEQIAASLRERFGHLLKPAVHLRARDGAAGFSRLGGLPVWPMHFAWPEFNGKPLAFLAQIDLSEIHAALPSFLPATGRLYFFYDQEQSVWGFDPKDAEAWRVLYFNGDPAECFPRTAPRGLDPACIYREKFVAPKRIDLLPDHESLGKELEPEDVWDAYLDLRSEPFGDDAPHQMLGYPAPVQGPDMELECQLASNGLYCGDETGYKSPRAAELKAGAADWKLLLQLDSDDDTGWMWGDVGTIYFWVREQDARHGDFSKVWMVLQCS